MIDPRHIWNVIYISAPATQKDSHAFSSSHMKHNAWSNRCHDPASPNTAPARKNDTAKFETGEKVKSFLQCGDDQAWSEPWRCLLNFADCNREPCSVAILWKAGRHITSRFFSSKGNKSWFCKAQRSAKVENVKKNGGLKTSRCWLETFATKTTTMKPSIVFLNCWNLFLQKCNDSLRELHSFLPKQMPLTCRNSLYLMLVNPVFGSLIAIPQTLSGSLFGSPGEIKPPLTSDIPLGELLQVLHLQMSLASKARTKLEMRCNFCKKLEEPVWVAPAHLVSDAKTSLANKLRVKLHKRR